MLDKEALERYNRNILLDGIGQKGQEKLKAAKVLVVGAGGLGSPVLYYLAAAGIGSIGICDGDVVDLSNLQRQILHRTQDIDINKAESAAQKIRALNPSVNIEMFKEKLIPQNIFEIIKNYDLVIEAVDVLNAKFLINDACVMAKIPLVRASALAFSGQIMSVNPGVSACYSCLFDTPPKIAMPTSASVGILGAAAGLFGTLEANEAIKIITGVGIPLFDCLLTCDIRSMDFRKITIRRNPNCRACGDEAVKKLDSSLY
ncbi:MAG: HesA/MoeB/ThiF family protein [Helicobacter sp.]|nr:HesA/MoeB/ThiF family protein [Helicobacter sp.]